MRVSNKPIRRLVHTGNLGSYRGMGSTVSFLLNPSQISDVLSRHPDVQTMMNGLPPSGDWAIGYQFSDSVYGNVLVMQDPNGNWYFNGNSPATTSAINMPPYQSPVNPPGQPSCTDSVADFLTCAEGYASVGLMVVGGYMIYRLLK